MTQLAMTAEPLQVVLADPEVATTALPVVISGIFSRGGVRRRQKIVVAAA